jgi:hypothetical protein
MRCRIGSPPTVAASIHSARPASSSSAPACSVESASRDSCNNLLHESDASMPAIFSAIACSNQKSNSTAHLAPWPPHPTQVCCMCLPQSPAGEWSPGPAARHFPTALLQAIPQLYSGLLLPHCRSRSSALLDPTSLFQPWPPFLHSLVQRYLDRSKSNSHFQLHSRNSLAASALRQIIGRTFYDFSAMVPLS